MSQGRYCPRCGEETDEPYCPKDGTATVLPDVRGVGGGDFDAGAVIEGRYRINETIGRGGFGAVYSAVHTGTNQDVALKVMLGDAADVDKSAVRRFYKEAQVTARLQHPNTVRVFDVGQTQGGALYIAMELLRGPTLEDLLRDLGSQGTGMTERRALDIAIPVLRSLAEAHALELVHRDLKPANIMLSEVIDDDPVVKVLDFGIARTADSSLTGQGTALGTPVYMSPEQCLGRVVDGRSDLYSLGVILFRCLAGRVPFDDRNPLTIMYKHAHEVPPDLKLIAKSKVSDGLSICVMRALAKKPEDRFDSAKDMRAALEGVREGTWRPEMDGQTAAMTALMRKNVARADPAPPPGDTMPYTGDLLDETASIDILHAETAPNREKDAEPRTREPGLPRRSRSGAAPDATVAYADDPQDEEARRAAALAVSDTALTSSLPEHAADSAAFGVADETHSADALSSEIARPSSTGDDAVGGQPIDGPASAAQGGASTSTRNVAIAVVSAAIVLGLAALMWPSDKPESAASSATAPAAGERAQPARAETGETAAQDDKNAGNAGQADAEPDTTESSTGKPDAVGSGNGAVDAGGTDDDANGAIDGADVSPVAVKPASPALSTERSKRARSRRAPKARTVRRKAKSATASPRPPVAVVPPPPPPAIPKPVSKPKPKPAARPIALD